MRTILIWDAREPGSRPAQVSVSDEAVAKLMEGGFEVPAIVGDTAVILSVTVADAATLDLMGGEPDVAAETVLEALIPPPPAPPPPPEVVRAFFDKPLADGDGDGFVESSGRIAELGVKGTMWQSDGQDERKRYAYRRVDKA